MTKTKTPKSSGPKYRREVRKTSLPWPVYAAYARQRTAGGGGMPAGWQTVELMEGAQANGATLALGGADE